MSTPFLELFVAGTILALIQFIAALPWLWAIDPLGFRRWVRDPAILGYAGAAVLAAGAGIALLLGQGGDTASVQRDGRIYGSILHLQLAVDFFVLVPQLLLWIWPKGGAVALATFRESIRQPMFWLVAGLATLLIIVSMVIPYNTFGEDYKMMKQLGFDTVMLSAALFGLLAASISIHEEIEGRTAITVMSKPINRRQFLIGKYVGVLLACWAMTLLLGWVLNWALYIKASGFFDRLDDVNDTMPVEVQNLLTPSFANVIPTPEGKVFAQGVAVWTGEVLAHHVGLLLNFGQVMVLLAICTALATRMQFVVNLTICLVIFLLGHLAPVLVQVTGKMVQEGSSAMQLVYFVAQLLNAVFPALEYFDMGPAIIRDNPVPMWDFFVYVLSVFGYSLLYTAIALILGLVMFEDRDLA
jgi:ABC-2 family transporter protein